MRDGEAADDACGGHAAVNSCGGEVGDGAGKADPLGSGRQWVQDGGRYDPVLGWMEEGEEPRKVELAPQNPATKGVQWVQDGVLQKGIEDAATLERSWLLVNPLSLRGRAAGGGAC